MSKNLIINRLNKCKAFQFNQSDINKDGSISKASTSTKTQESPQLLNPQFTFKAADFQNSLSQKGKLNQFFDDFNPNEQITYQKVVLKKPKVLQRSLEFELMNLYRQGKEIQEYTAIKKLQFSDEEEVERSNQSLETRFKVQQNQQKNYQVIKTEYVQGRECRKYMNPGHKEYFEDNLPYDCRKYKLQREKLNANKEPKLIRCLTEAETQSFVQNPSYLSDACYESKPFNDNHFKSLDIKENQPDFFNQYYFKNPSIDPSHQDHNNKLFAKKSNSMGIHIPKRQGNSSRLSFFRKEREQQIRKSLLEEHNQSKNNQFLSNQNKENIENSSAFVPSLALKNQIIQNKKLQGQFSERYLFDRRYTMENGPKKLSYHIPKSSISYIHKQNESRIHSIRNQLKDIYQIRDEDRSRLKIKRDHQIFEQNARNQLRKIGSICRL